MFNMDFDFPPIFLRLKLHSLVAFKRKKIWHSIHHHQMFPRHWIDWFLFTLSHLQFITTYRNTHTNSIHRQTNILSHSVIRVSTYSHTIRFCKMKIFLNVSLFVRLQQVILLISKMLHDISSHGNRFDYNSYTNIKLKSRKVKKRNLLFPRISW